MDSQSIGPIQGGALPLRRIDHRQKREGRPFVLPRPGEDGDDAAEPENEHGVLEPRPRSLEGRVSRERAADEAGQHIDVRG